MSYRASELIPRISPRVPLFGTFVIAHGLEVGEQVEDFVLVESLEQAGLYAKELEAST